jgi:hypothetical protein
MDLLMTTKGQRAIVIAAVDNLLTDEEIADMSAAERRKVIAALQHTIDRLKERRPRTTR